MTTPEARPGGTLNVEQGDLRRDKLSKVKPGDTYESVIEAVRHDIAAVRHDVDRLDEDVSAMLEGLSEQGKSAWYYVTWCVFWLALFGFLTAVELAGKGVL